MSVVSGVTLICGLIESDDDDGDDLLYWLNGLLEPQNIHFKEVANNGYGGNKHPQHFTFGAGINYLDEDKFAESVIAREWQQPKNVILIIQPEDGVTRVFHPIAGSEVHITERNLYSPLLKRRFK